MIGESSFHRGSHPKGTQNVTPVVPAEIQRQGRSQVRPPFAERIRQAHQSANFRSHGSVASLDMRGANSLGVRIAPYRFRHSLYNSWWRVPMFVGIGGVHLDELRERHPRSEACQNGIHVRRETVCGDLKVSRRGLVQLLDKERGILSRPASEGATSKPALSYARLPRTYRRLPFRGRP